MRGASVLSYGYLYERVFVKFRNFSGLALFFFYD